MCLFEGEEISAYLDGELSEKRRAAVRDHLTHCRRCRRIWQEQWEIKYLLSRTFSHRSFRAWRPRLKR